jgi:hypothetical protein
MSSSNDNKENTLTNDLNSLYNTVFNKYTVVLLIWFLALHFTCYWLLKYFFSENIENLDYQAKLSRFLDIAILVFLTMFLTASYYSTHQKDKEIILENIAYRTKEYITDKDSIYATVVFILFLYCIIYLFRIPMNSQTKPYFIMITEYTAWFLLLVIIFTKFFNDVFNFSMIDTIYTFFDWSGMPDDSSDSDTKNSKVESLAQTDATNSQTTTAEPSATRESFANAASSIREYFENINTTQTSVPLSEIKKLDDYAVKTNEAEVFNVTGGFSYDDAQLVCAAYSSKLATYDQIEESYNKGGEWCNYGWSEGQHAYFPTQKDTWKKLQMSSDENLRQSCGRPGVNGGYLKDVNTKIGINCFGKRPEVKDKDLLAKQQQLLQVFAKSKEEENLNDKVEYWKQKIDDGEMKINHYNYGSWSNKEKEI